MGEAPAVDPRLVAIGLASELVVEFPEGTVELDMLDDAAAQAQPPVARPAAPPFQAAVAQPAVPDAPAPVAVTPPPRAASHPPLEVVFPEPVKSAIAEPPPAEALVIRTEPAAVEEALPQSAVLVQTAVVTGIWPTRGELSIEELGLRVTGRAPVAIRWSDVTAIQVGRERVNVRTKRGTTRIALAIDGVAAPDLNGSFLGLLDEARGGTLDLQGSAVHDLQNAMDAVRDTFHSSDDPFIPLALGGALSLLTLILAFFVPEMLSFITRPAVPANAFVLGSRLAPFDPRVLLVAVAAACVVTSLTARLALGSHATAWARGTLRGWHIERSSVLVPLRRAVSLVFLYPAVAGAALVLALVVALPSARSHATVDSRAIHVVRPLPLFDRSVAWPEVDEILPLPVSGPDHPHGLAVLIRTTDGWMVTTQDLPVRNSTDRYFLELTRKWYDASRSR